MHSVNWQRTIDQIILSTLSKDDRSIGLTSIRSGSGVSLICRYLAKTLAADRLRVLLLDLSQARTPVHAATKLSQPDALRKRIEPSHQGYDQLVAHSTDPDDTPIIDLPQLRELLRTQLSDYDHIVIDMPPVLNEAASGVNPVTAGGMCDQLLLVTRLKRDNKAELIEVVSMLRDAGIQPSALLTNQFK